MNVEANLDECLKHMNVGMITVNNLGKDSKWIQTFFEATLPPFIGTETERVRERQRDRETERQRERESERGRERVCVYVCVCEREREHS